MTLELDFYCGCPFLLNDFLRKHFCCEYLTFSVQQGWAMKPFGMYSSFDHDFREMSVQILQSSIARQRLRYFLRLTLNN